MLDEVERLPEDLSKLVHEVDGDLSTETWKSIVRPYDRVLLFGCGDSLQAATIGASYIESIAGMVGEVVAPRRATAKLFDARYATARRDVDEVLCVGISASGATPAVCRALSSARQAGTTTIAITGADDSPLSRIAEQTLVVRPDDVAVSAGIRTFQASLIGLMLIANHIGAARGHIENGNERAIVDSIVRASEHLRLDIDANRSILRGVAEQTARSPIMLFLAADPHLAMARYAAAKRIEASGLCAWGQDFEEALHVEQFALPVELPTVIIGPSGATAPEAEIAALNARGLGRNVYTISSPVETTLRRHANMAIDIRGATPDIMAPFFLTPVLSSIAAHEAIILDRTPFREDIAERRERRERYRKSFE